MDIIIAVLQPVEVKSLVQGHIASKWQRQDLNPVLTDSQASGFRTAAMSGREEENGALKLSQLLQCRDPDELTCHPLASSCRSHSVVYFKETPV